MYGTRLKMVTPDFQSKVTPVDGKHELRTNMKEMVPVMNLNNKI